MESMYKVGDVVRIRDDLVPDILYPTECSQATKLYFVEEMLDLLGCECTITKVERDNDRILYEIKEDNGDCWWCSSMFEGRVDDIDNTEGMSVNLDCLIGGDDL